MLFLRRVVYLLGLCLFTSIISHIQIELVVENQDGNSGVVPEELLDERIGSGYSQTNNTWCFPYVKLVHSILEAKEICSKDVKCFAIYDDGGAKERFLLCEIGAKIEMSNSGSLLYLKDPAVEETDRNIDHSERAVKVGNAGRRTREIELGLALHFFAMIIYI